MIPDGFEWPSHVVVTTKRRGLRPTAHLPSEDDPAKPHCGQVHAYGGGWRREDPDEFDDEQLCYRYLSNDSLRKAGDNSLYLRCVELRREGSA